MKWERVRDERTSIWQGGGGGGGGGKRKEGNRRRRDIEGGKKMKPW